MKYLPIFNKGDKVTVNNKYIGLKSMVGEIYTIRAGPARCSDTWCYWLENVAGGIAADALEPLEQTNEEYLRSLNTEQLAEWFGDWHSFSCVFCKHWKNGCIYNHNQVRCAIEEGKSNKELWVEWLKQPHTFE